MPYIINVKNQKYVVKRPTKNELKSAINEANGCNKLYYLWVLTLIVGRQLTINDFTGRFSELESLIKEIENKVFKF